MKKIAIVGMEHCGSTMLSNMIRTAAKLSGYSINNNDFDLERDMIIQKRHEYDKYFIDNNYKIICPLRDIRDCCITSFLRFGMHNKYRYHDNELIGYDDMIQIRGLDYFIINQVRNIELFEAYSRHEPYIFHYENYKTDSLRVTMELLKFIELPHDESFVQEVVWKTENMKNRDDLYLNLSEFQQGMLQNKNMDSYDKLLTKDHITDGGRIGKYKDFFTSHQLTLMYRYCPRIKQFLQTWNYTID